MGFLTRCKRPFLFAFLLQFCNMLFSFFLKTFLILFEKQQLPLPEMVCFFSKLITPGPCSLTLSESSGRARESNTGFASHRASAHSSRSFSIPCLKQRLFSNCLFICPSIFAPPITFNKALPSTRSYTPYTFLYACFQARSMQIPRILTRIHFSLYIISFIGF